MKPLKRFVAVTALLASGVLPPAARAGDAKAPADPAYEEAKALAGDREAEMRALEEQLRAAQAQMRDAARRLAELGRAMGNRNVDRQRSWRWMWSVSDHAGLGVVVRTSPDGSPDTNGAPLVGVTPGGPAEQAGLKAGDVITEINGVALSLLPGGAGAHIKGDDEEDEDVDMGDDDATPSAQLVLQVRKLKDGDKVSVKYRRGKETRAATIIARRLDPQPPMAISVNPDIRIDPVVLPEIPALAPMALPGPWMQMELVSLNPDLGSYFSTDHGVLVVRPPRSGGLKLRGGDVILKIGDETPTSPANAMRLLRPDETDEPIQILVLRKGEKMTVTAAASTFAPRRRAPAPPAPVAPPAPPQPPQPRRENL